MLPYQLQIVPLRKALFHRKLLSSFFINSDSNLTQTQMLTLKLVPNQTLILTPKKANEKSTDENFSFLFYSPSLENFR